MSRVSLYRKWRPRAFSTIVGQEPVVRTLKRAIEMDRVAHAYLFSGPRGTGKTSTAKVLAMGLNCQRGDGPTPEPCGECGSCRAIINNSSMDVLEMDAASNRGIDEIRDLRDQVNLAPVQGRMKIYIIDEVHMLTTEAFNALLKMLEEPPRHVVFVLATTEKHKVLPTIVSRCQSFDFRRPSVETLAGKLAEIASAEGIEAEPEAMTVIAREGRGSFRDAEGLLDQISSFSDGRVTAGMVRELLGSVGPQTLLEATDALYERRAADALKIVDEVSNAGSDLGQFVQELTAHLRNLMLLPHAPEVALSEVGAGERASLEEQAGRVPTAAVVRMIEALGDHAGRVKRGGDPKLELELTFLKLARGYAEPDVQSLIQRIETLEQTVRDGVAPRPEGGRSSVHGGDVSPVYTPDRTEPGNAREETGGPGAAGIEDESADHGMAGAGKADGGTEEARGESVEPRGEPDDAQADDDTASLEREWAAVIRELKTRRQAPAAAVFEQASVEGFEDGVLRLSFPKGLGIYVRLAGDEKRMSPLQDVLEERLGIRPRLEFGVSEAAGDSPGVPLVGDGGSPLEPPAAAPGRGAERHEPGDGSALEALEGRGPDGEVDIAPEARGEHGAGAWPDAEANRSRPDDQNGSPVKQYDGGGSLTRETAGESEGPDDIIRDPQDALRMAREMLGGGGS